MQPDSYKRLVGSQDRLEIAYPELTMLFQTKQMNCSKWRANLRPRAKNNYLFCPYFKDHAGSQVSLTSWYNRRAQCSPERVVVPCLLSFLTEEAHLVPTLLVFIWHQNNLFSLAFKVFWVLKLLCILTWTTLGTIWLKDGIYVCKIKTNYQQGETKVLCE